MALGALSSSGFGLAPVTSAESSKELAQVPLWYLVLPEARRPVASRL